MEDPEKERIILFLLRAWVLIEERRMTWGVVQNWIEQQLTKRVLG